MMTILSEKPVLKRIALLTLVLLMFMLVELSTKNNLLSSTEASMSRPAVDKAVLAGMQDTTTTSSTLEAIAAQKPILFVFTPVDQCVIQYCLTARLVQTMVATKFDDILTVIEVPIFGSYSGTSGTAPSFLIAGWNLYPVEPYIHWLPEAILTPNGWGLPGTKLVLVNAEGILAYDFGSVLDLDVLENILG